MTSPPDHAFGSRARFLHLRNHRELLVVDGVRAFAGGMSIREGCRRSSTTSACGRR
jgi:phosphatidylserine/phosphatidylglycerophosphate/cardiolipin synthase-like enzyme